MLSRIHIKNFRSFSEIEVGPFSRVNLITGLNNSGKTGLLEALFLGLSLDKGLVLFPLLAEWRVGQAVVEPPAGVGILGEGRFGHGPLDDVQEVRGARRHSSAHARGLSPSTSDVR